MAVLDVKRAYCDAPAARPLHSQVTQEDWEEGDDDRVGRWELSLYGTRSAAPNWASTFAILPTMPESRHGTASPCHLWHQDRDIKRTGHGGDPLVVAILEARWLEAAMRREYVFTVQLPPEKVLQQEARISNRTLDGSDTRMDVRGL